MTYTKSKTICHIFIKLPLNDTEKIGLTMVFQNTQITPIIKKGNEFKGTVHEKTFFLGKGALGPS